MVDKVDANRNLSNAKAVEAVLENLLNSHGGSADSFLKVAKAKLRDTRKQIESLKELLK